MNNEKVDIPRFFSDHGIKVAQEGQRHFRMGWIHTQCPFCSGHKGHHLGYNKAIGVFTCFRCGRHGKYETIASFLGISKKEAYRLCEEKYMLSRFDVIVPEKRMVHIKLSRIKLPGSKIPTEIEKEYLLKRKFDPNELQRIWDIRYGGHLGDWKFRIIIPITYKGKVVTWTGRTVADNEPRYLNLSLEKSVRDPKLCIYGADKNTYKDCIVVEGPTDVWRLGIGAVATLGIKFRLEQVRLIAKQFRRSLILFDPGETQAQMQAEKLCMALSAYREHKSEMILVDSKNDPGDFSPIEVKEVRKWLKKSI